MQDRPRRGELLQGIVHFLESNLVPVLEEPLRFHTRVAANLLRIIERETDLEAQQLRREAAGLQGLLGQGAIGGEVPLEQLREEVERLNRELCRRIREGLADADPWHREVLNHLRETGIAKLEIANPRIISQALTRR